MICKHCGGTGKLLNGDDCPYCKKVTFSTLDKSCITVPLDYRGVSFNKDLVTPIDKVAYGEELDKIHTGIIRNSLLKRNYLIASPPKHSKTILCYSAIQHLYKDGVDVFPLVDTGEVKRLLTDTDNGNKESDILLGINASIASLYTAPYVFVRISNILTYSTFDVILTLLDRRTRRSNSTIFIYNGKWEDLLRFSKNRFNSIVGDGTMGTVIVKSFYEKEE